MGSVGSNNTNIKTVMHYTSAENGQSIMDNDFNLTRSGEQSPTKGFVNFGNAVYFTNGKVESGFYAGSKANAVAIQADVDTSKMKEINLGKQPVKSYDEMYQKIVSQLPKNIQKEYNEYMKSHGPDQRSKAYISSEAFSTILPRHYSGLIIKQQSKEFDYISGGNQIVVYDKSVIKNKKLKRR